MNKKDNYYAAKPFNVTELPDASLVMILTNPFSSADVLEPTLTELLKRVREKAHQKGWAAGVAHAENLRVMQHDTYEQFDNH